MDSNKKLNILDYLKKKNVKRFSLFFVIAFVFLIFSKLSNDYKQAIRLEVSIANTEDEIIIQNDSLNSIEAYVEAKGFTLIPFLFDNSKDIILDAKTDVASKPGRFVFDVQKHKFLIEGQLGDSYKLLSIKPDTLVLTYSKRASKMVPIILKNTIDYDVGYDIKGNFNLSIDSVKIVGSSDDVNNIKALNTEELTLENTKTNIEETVHIDISEYENIEIYPESIEVSAEVTRFTEGTIDIPVTIINKPKKVSINYFPKTVSVSYYVDLKNYKAIKASDFIVECNYSNIKDNQTYFVPKIVKKPNFVKRIDIKQKRIDFIKL